LQNQPQPTATRPQQSTASDLRFSVRRTKIALKSVFIGSFATFFADFTLSPYLQEINTITETADLSAANAISY
jgi:hypothetical protein